MHTFWGKQWEKYLANLDWYDALDTQCRPLNLLAILAGIFGVEMTLYAMGVFRNPVYLWVASFFGVLGVTADFIAWNLRHKPHKFFVVIPTLIGLDALFYGLCVSFTALSIAPPYNYGMWCLYFSTLVYWGTVSGYSLICTLFMVSSPFVCLLFMSNNPVEFAFWAFGVLMYVIISRNTGHRKMEESKRSRTDDVVKALDGLLGKCQKQSKGKLNNEESFGLLEIQSRIDSLDCVRFKQRLPDVKVFGQLEYLMFVLANLADNAVDAGANAIELEVEQHDGLISIYFHDNGSGIPQEEISRLFKPLGSNKPDGVGMGLSLSRQFLRGYGGDLEFVKGDEGGSSFKIKLARCN